MVVLMRGVVPCHVLFIGEAPGASEDSLGLPFQGPAGKLLDRIIGESLPETVRFAMTNLVSCIPKIDGEKDQPLPEHIEACSPRLREAIQIASPKLIVCVGTLADDYLDIRTHKNVWVDHVRLGKRIERRVSPLEKIPRIKILHPAYILRQNTAQQTFLTQKCVAAIVTAIEEYGVI